VDPDRLAATLRELLAAHGCSPAAVYLYGSQARDEARASSDVDLAILFGSPPEATLAGLPLEIEAALESRIGRPVQIVALEGAPADLVHRVLRDGRLLIENDRSARIRFEVAARNEYFDLEPVRRAYRRGRTRAA
jgi:hypothetical protein